MRRLLLACVVCLATLGIAPVLARSAAAATPNHLISVSGASVQMYPAFAASVHRYGITTQAATAGTVTVTAATSDKTGRLWIDGQHVASGTEKLTGLTSGDEISVFIKDSAGTAVYSLIYLPAGFPVLTVSTKKAGIAPGDVFLTLSDFTGKTPSYETVVDNNGVPIFVHEDVGPPTPGGTTPPDAGVPTDFKKQPNGDYTVFRQPTTAGSGHVIELNGKFQQIGAFETAPPLKNTGGHDSIFEPNGDKWFFGDQGDVNTGTDNIIQEQGPDGHVLFSWNTVDHVTPATDSVIATLPGDYAHLNSIALMPNGNILASFRHLGQVMDISTSGPTSGNIVWSFGGRHPTLATASDPDGGPCAQHDATVLANSHILLFDDGSTGVGTVTDPRLCVDPTNRTGPAIDRPVSRVTEYAINTAANTATLVWSFSHPGTAVDSSFGGSAQRFSNGNTLIGWGGTQVSLATEVNSAKQVLWELSDSAGLVSYRALRYSAPDKIAPVVSVTRPTEGASYAFGQKVASAFSCTDKGGSSLASCNGGVAEGAGVPTSSPGTHTFTVVGKDGAGNTTTVTRTYHVGAAPAHYQPDAMVKRPSAESYVGANIYGTAAKQHIGESIAHAGKFAQALVRVQNDSNRTDQITIDGSAGTSKFKVAYFAGSRNITKRVVAGTYETLSLAPGHAFALRVKVTRTAKAKAGTSLKVRVLVTSLHSPTKHDAVATVIHATS